MPTPMNHKPERAATSAQYPAPFVLAPQRTGGEPYTTSEIIADGTGIDRRKVKDAIRKYQTDLEAFGRVASYQAPLETKGGVQTIIGYILNEQQATFLLTLLKNTPVVVEFKKELVRQFYAMRALLLERASPIWQDTRSLGKEIRRQETDAIKRLVDYATAQGSRNAAWYYTTLSKLANHAAGIVERDTAQVVQLTTLLLVEKMITKEIVAEIEAEQPYKAIYTGYQGQAGCVLHAVCSGMRKAPCKNTDQSTLQEAT